MKIKMFVKLMLSLQLAITLSFYAQAQEWTEEYGPLIKTTWDQESPYNNECPTVDGVRVKAGCVTISSAQVLNYYKVCNAIDIEGHHSIYSNAQSPYFSNVTATETGEEFDYSYSYTPDFDKISTDTAELAKFIMGVALAQYCYFDVQGSMTSYWTQSGAFTNTFGYDSELCEDADDVLSFIIKNIKQNKPIIVSDSSMKHSYIFDGYRNNGTNEQMHINFGWGGYMDDWYELSSIRPEVLVAILVYPSSENSIKMQENPVLCHVKGIDNDYDKTFVPEDIFDTDDHTVQIELMPGTYSYWFEYADGTTIAPVLKGDINLVYDNNLLLSRTFKREPAQFVVKHECNVMFVHSIPMGYIDVQGWNFIDPEFRNYGTQVVLSDGKHDMEYDEQNECYFYNVEIEPGQTEIGFYIPKLDKYLGPDMDKNYISLKYEVEEGTLPSLNYNWETEYNTDKIKINLNSEATFGEKNIPIEKVTLRVCVNKYKFISVDDINFTTDSMTMKVNMENITYYSSTDRFEGYLTLLYNGEPLYNYYVRYDDVTYVDTVVNGKKIATFTYNKLSASIELEMVIDVAPCTLGEELCYKEAYIKSGETIFEYLSFEEIEVSGFDNSVIGEQQVTFTCLGMQTTATVCVLGSYEAVQEQLPTHVVWISGKTIHVEGIASNVAVYDVLGHCVAVSNNESDHVQINVPQQGIYIVKVGNEAKRVMVQ